MARSKSISSHWMVSLISTFLTLGVPIHRISAQTYNFEVQTIPLKGDFINFSGKCFMQDSEGFMWFGSADGLYRYHGTGVKVYRHIPNNENSLSNNFIMDLYEDSEGVIWIGTKNGLNRFDKYTETFKWYRNQKGNSTSITPGEINKVAEDREGNLWIANDGGFNRFDRGTETFENYRILREPEAAIKDPYQIFDLIPDKEYLWLTTGDGLYRYTVPSGKMEHIKEALPPHPWSVFMDRSGRYWLPCFKALLLLDPLELSYKPFPNRPDNQKKITNQHIRTMLEDGSGNIWIRSLEGIYCFNQALELKYFLTHSHRYSESYGNQEMTKEMFMDNSGAIWFFSPEGINQIRNIKRNFKICTPDTMAWVRCIYPESKGRVWFGTLHGIHRLDREKNLMELIYGHADWLQGFPFSARTMYLDREGILWIGMSHKGLLSGTLSGTGEVTFRENWPVNVDSSRMEESGFYGIEHLFEDAEGRLWVGPLRKHALQYYDRAENRMIRLVDIPSSTDRLPERAVIRHQTGTDTLWAIGSSGVYRINLPFRKISENKVFPADVFKCRLKDEDGKSFEPKSVTSTYMDGYGDLWIGSMGKGLYRIKGIRNPGSKENECSVNTYTTLQGLPGNQVLSILPDGKGNLWMGTDNGLTKFNVLSETFTNYYIRHGLPVNEFIYKSAAIDEDGEMYFGTLDGLISFYPDSIEINRNIPPVRITDMKINNQLIQPGNNIELKNAITFTDTIKLNYNHDNLSIEYAILNYDNPELNQYRYMLEGFNDNWVYTGNRTIAEFTNLGPGRYIFHVQGSNNDGIWNEEGTSLQITITPPPWQTWYAYLLYGLFMAGILLWYRNYQRNRAKLRMAVEVEKIEKEKIQEIDQMKSRFFANISHEFRTPLTLILGPLEKLYTKKSGETPFSRDLVVLMRSNARRLLKLINQLLDISKLETGKITLQVSENDIIYLIRTLVLSFLSLAESKKINYEYDLPDSPQRVYYDQDKLEKILTNLISNAFKFTPALGRVRIKVQFVTSHDQEGPHTIEIKVSDSGKGIPQDQIEKIFDRFYQVGDSDTREQEGSGIGLALTKEMVDLYRGELRVESTKGAGSIFTVRLPVSKEQFNPEEIVITHEKADHGPFQPDLEPDEPEEAVEAATDMNQTPRKSETDPVILIVEDNVDLMNYISSNLGYSYHILMAGNGRQGLDRAIESIPDLVISDVMMPDMDGIEMCRQLKQNDRTNHIPVILLTAKADSRSKMEGLKTGADDYIIKPFNEEELQVRVTNLINQRQKLRDKFMQTFIMEPDVESQISPQDKLMQEIMDILNHNLDKAEFSISQMSWELNMSRSQLYRKVSALTGLSPTDLLRSIRLRTAATLFKSGHDNVSQVMHQVGFSNHSYFAKCFKKQYQMNPSEYINRRNS